MTAAPATQPYVIDSDAHVLEPPHLWDEYLEPEFRPRAIRIVQGVPGRDGRPGIIMRPYGGSADAGHFLARAMASTGASQIVGNFYPELDAMIAEQRDFTTA
ncbi:MAG: hypothetical protein IIB19_07305 [Chloroflexi bacterium]|nr:hypothetical protein [Chloroflexota bacterium]